MLVRVWRDHPPHPPCPIVIPTYKVDRVISINQLVLGWNPTKLVCGQTLLQRGLVSEPRLLVILDWSFVKQLDKGSLLDVHSR